MTSILFYGFMAGFNLLMAGGCWANGYTVLAWCNLVGACCALALVLKGLGVA